MALEAGRVPLWALRGYTETWCMLAIFQRSNSMVTIVLKDRAVPEILQTYSYRRRDNRTRMDSAHPLLGRPLVLGHSGFTAMANPDP